MNKKLSNGFVIGLVLFATGCARFSTHQVEKRYDENEKLTAVISTKAYAYTLFSAKSSLTKFKASQSEKTQSASVGGLEQETTGTNTVEALKELNTMFRTLGL